MNNPKNLELLKNRIMRLQERQNKSMAIINQLKRIFTKISETPHQHETTATPTVGATLLDHDYDTPCSSSQTSSYSIKNEQFHGYSDECKQGPKQETLELKQEVERFPKVCGHTVILGPNGTQLDLDKFNRVNWLTSKSATRQLLDFLFTSDVLATHTLSGKPSPAFHGRERPEKQQLDPIMVNDIICCVRSKCKCTEREIRATITTKCSDSSKKYRKNLQKQLLKSSNTAE